MVKTYKDSGYSPKALSQGVQKPKSGLTYPLTATRSKLNPPKVVGLTYIYSQVNGWTFNPLSTFSANQFKIPKFDTLIMRLNVIEGFHS